MINLEEDKVEEAAEAEIREVVTASVAIVSVLLAVRKLRISAEYLARR